MSSPGAARWKGVEAVARAEGFGLADAEAFATLVVWTENSVYRTTVLRPYRRDVLAQGGVFFAVPTLACLNGSSFGGTCLKLGWIGVGLRMELHAED